MEHPPVILSIAGSDCSGGAGIQADIKTISALGGYAASAITAVTVQNTMGVRAVQAMEDLQPVAIKIGMVNDIQIVHVIADCLRKYAPEYVVYDPVMVSTSGRKLMTDEAIEEIKKELLPLVTLLTPNIDEATVLTGKSIHNIREMQEIESNNMHGTVCTLSTAIATYLAKGYPMREAIQHAKTYITQAIMAGKDLHIGHGNGPLWHFPDSIAQMCTFCAVIS